MRFNEITNEPLDDVKQIWTDLGIDFSLNQHHDTIYLNKIVVPEKSRKTGIGTKAMTALVDYADRTGQKIALTPSADFGGNEKRLVKFYRQFDFIPNKGRYRDFTTRETMIRFPKK